MTDPRTDLARRRPLPAAAALALLWMLFAAVRRNNEGLPDTAAVGYLPHTVKLHIKEAALCAVFKRNLVVKTAYAEGGSPAFSAFDIISADP